MPVRYILAVMLAALLAACDGSENSSKISSPPSFLLTDISGASFARDVRLVDHTGRSRSIADFKGSVVALFFGYIHCPDLCAPTMAKLAATMSELGDKAERVQVLFVTIDPEQDTPEALAKYVSGFNPTFLGLSGDAQEIDTTLKEFKVVHQKQINPVTGQTTTDHSMGIYIFDTAGKIRLYADNSKDQKTLAHDMKVLLDQS